MPNLYPTASFPSSIWDGTSSTRESRDQYSEPDPNDWARILSELIATQTELARLKGQRKRVTANFTNNNGTLGNLTDLSVDLLAGEKYKGYLNLMISTDQAAEGAKFDFDGGTATMTSFLAALSANIQGATVGVGISSAIATDLTLTALANTNTHFIKYDFNLVVNAAGTFIPRAAQNSHTSGTLTVLAGSSLIMDLLA